MVGGLVSRMFGWLVKRDSFLGTIRRFVITPPPPQSIYFVPSYVRRNYVGHSRQELSVCQFGCTGAKSISQSFSSLYFVTYSRILISLMRPLSSLHFFLMHLITSVNFFLTLPHLPYASSSPSSSCVLSPPSIHPSCVPSPPSMLDLIPLIRPFSSPFLPHLPHASLSSYVSLMRPPLLLYLPHASSSPSPFCSPSISSSLDIISLMRPLSFYFSLIYPLSSHLSFLIFLIHPFSSLSFLAHPPLPSSRHSSLPDGVPSQADFR